MFTSTSPPRADDRDEDIDRLLVHGARRVGIGQTGAESWTFLADPERNEFCVYVQRRRSSTNHDRGASGLPVRLLHLVWQTIQRLRGWACTCARGGKCGRWPSSIVADWSGARKIAAMKRFIVTGAHGSGKTEMQRSPAGGAGGCAIVGAAYLVGSVTPPRLCAGGCAHSLREVR